MQTSSSADATPPAPSSKPVVAEGRSVAPATIRAAAPLVDPALGPASHAATRRQPEQRVAESSKRISAVQPANHVDPIPGAITLDQPIVHGSIGGEVIYADAPVQSSEAVCGCEGPICDCDMGCDGLGSCDPGVLGCDSYAGCDGLGWGGSRRFTNGSISFCRDRWFGELELLLMFRRGDLLPPLVTTGPSGNADTAGQLGEAGTEVLVGNERIFEDMTVGGRFTLGTWLDDSQCRSLVLRAWHGGEDEFSFKADNNDFAVLTRPFNDVTTDADGVADTQLIAFPNQTSGSIAVKANSNVYGGDLSVRQYLTGRWGGSIDLLYGYQYMRLEEDLSINGISTSLDDAFAPIGAVIAIDDEIETHNEFHGGQFGLATQYREGCWTLDLLAKVGFGSLRRRIRQTGRTTTGVDSAVAVDDQGLLVRDSNSGAMTDHTFGWIPELDLSLSYRRFPNYDLSFGYHIIAMTDAIRPSDALDPDLRVNLSDPLVGSARPAIEIDPETFYIQGIHFGISRVY